ncbi:MAG: amino acid adenylation domain-containing protein, partial [Cyanobacteria bacterium P01_F01_bin.86]
MSNLIKDIANLSPEKRELLMQRLKQKRGNLAPQTPKIRPQSRESGTYPLSFAQQRLWFLEQLEPGNPFYNQPAAAYLTGSLNLAVLEQSLNEVGRRHETLRTTFSLIEEKPVQVIQPTLNLKLPVIDLRDLPQAEAESQVRRFVAEEGQRPFNLSAGPLLRGTLLQLDEAEYVLLLTMHHIISDGWSTGIFLRELAVLYEAFLAEKPSPFPDLPVQYVDFVVWQRQWLQGDVLEAQLAYWRQQLKNSPAVLQLPMAHSRPAIQTFRGTNQSLQLSAELTTALKDLSRAENATLFMTLLAAFKTLLYRYTGQDDILVGSPIANRNRSEIEGLIGFFVNTLVMRTDLGGSPSFRELLGRVRKVALDAYAHQDLPFEQVVNALQLQRDLSYTPLFQVLFEFGNVPMSALELTDLKLRPLKAESGAAKFDLSLSMRESGQELIGNLEYSTDLFDTDAIARILSHFQTLLESIVANPDQRLEDLRLLTEVEEQQLLVEWNNTQVAYPQHQCIHQLFEAQVTCSPDSIAVVFEQQQLTYQKLNARANQLAHHLRTLGVGSDVLVGICVERSLDMVVGLLGILKAGGAYVPLDPHYPQARLAYILTDAGVAVLLTQQSCVAVLPSTPAQVVCLDTDRELIEQHCQANLEVPLASDTLAYVIYTSGSTGQPKGVQIEHYSVVNFLQSMGHAPGLTRADSFYAVTTISFDIAALELYLPLTVGAKVIVASRETVSDAERLLSELVASKSTVMQATPATWQMLLAAGWSSQFPLKVLCGGEALSSQLAEQILSTGSELWNLYGPTEATIWSTCSPVERDQAVMDPDGKPCSIGRPIANTQVYILDEQHQPVPIGVAGELYIGGDGLARGYLNRPDLSESKFIPHPFPQEKSQVANSKLYKTGDLARYLPSGQIEFLGRIDYQVKIRGFRIELGEIEAVLCEHPQVQQAVVMAREDMADDKRLVAYVVAAEEPLSAPQLRPFAASKLPAYMVPGAFVSLATLPLTPNGKVDRKALPVPDENISRDSEHVAPRTPEEEIIANIFAAVLGVQRVGIHDNFFELGGHSLLATQLISRLRSALTVEIPLRAIF